MQPNISAFHPDLQDFFNKCSFSESWRLWMSIPACSPRLFQPLPLPRRPLAQNSPCHELCHVQIAFDLFDLRVGCFSLAVSLL